MHNDYITHDRNDDGVDRRGFLKCMAWAGTGMLWAASGGLVVSRILRPSTAQAADARADFTFVQISDSHIGFNKEANKDVLKNPNYIYIGMKLLIPTDGKAS